MTFARTAWDYFDVETYLQSLLVWNLQQFCENSFPKKFNSVENKLQSEDCRDIICKLSFVESLKSIYIDSIDKICSYLMSNLFKKQEDDDCGDGTTCSDDCCSESDSDEKGFQMFHKAQCTLNSSFRFQNVILTTNHLKTDMDTSRRKRRNPRKRRKLKRTNHQQ